jgi:hypothetical protein
MSPMNHIFAVLVLISAASCGGEPARESPCSTDGRWVRIFFAESEDELTDISGKLIGWSPEWVTLVKNGTTMHFLTSEISVVHEISEEQGQAY